MSNEKKPLKEGYQPQDQGRGYQPQPQEDTFIEQIQGGYTPTTGHGDDTSNPPEPPDEE